MRWNLSDLYSSPKDPNIQKDIQKASKKISEFENKYRGKVATLSNTQLLECIKYSEEIEELITKPSLYLSLKFEENSADDIVNNIKQKVEEQLTQILNNMIFFGIEYGQLPKEKTDEFENSEILSIYKNYLNKLSLFSKYNLSEPEERIISEKSLAGSSAFEKLFEHLTSKAEYSLNINGKKRNLNESEVLTLLKNPDREVREKASKIFTKGLKDLELPLLFIYNTLILDRQIEVRLRNIPSLEYTRHLSNEITPQIVDTLIKSVTDNYDLVKRYYNIKAKLLNLDTLYEYDRYAPLRKEEVNIPFEEGKEIVLSSFREFSSTFYDTAKKFFDNNWIDAFTQKGKRAGAFCAAGSPKLHPYILLNYMNKQSDVLTMAHEIGHGIHDVLSSNLPISVYHPPLVTAEMASVFAENIVFEKLMQYQEKTSVKVDLLTENIEETIATVFRQVSMYKFEIDSHYTRKNKGELTNKQIRGIWRKNQEDMFKGSVKLTGGYDYWWSYIPHFFESPFYVYAYAFGNLLVLSLIGQYKKEGDKFTDKYIKVLSSGDKIPPYELLKLVDVNIEDESFWNQGLYIIKDKIDQLEELIK